MSLLYATHARIHLGNVRDNLRAIRATVGPSRKVLIAVKANGYGHGAVEVSRMAEATGTAEWLGVATVPEGVQLREAGLRLPILKLGPTFPWEMRTAVEAGVTLATEVSDRWLEDFVRLSQIDPARLPLIRKILNALMPQVCFARLREGDQALSVGLGVLERGYRGLFDIATLEGKRRQGYATRVVRALTGWGRARGAHTAYLQVMRENAPALALYAKLGFAEVYTYWYRTRRVPGC